MPPLWLLSPLPLSLALAPVCARIARALSLVDTPRPDRFGARATPKLGGLVLILALLPFGVVASRAGAGPLFAAGAMGFLVAFVTGLLDDVRSLSPSVKLTGQILAACISVVWVTRETDPTGTLAALPVPVVSVLAIVWIVGFQNAVNFLDNMDGIVAGLAAIALGGLALQLPGDARSLAIAIGCATVGFLPWNAASPARLYLGDAGALPLGHALGYAAFVAAWTAPSLAGGAAALIIVLIPILDITFVTVTRLAEGRSPATGGRDHTTHRLFVRVGTVPRTRALVWSAALLLAALSLAVRSAPAPLAVAALAVLGAGCVAVGRGLASVPAPSGAGTD